YRDRDRHRGLDADADPDTGGQPTPESPVARWSRPSAALLAGAGVAAGGTLLSGTDFTGPTALVREPLEPGEAEAIGRILLRYAHRQSGTVEVRGAEGRRELPVSEPCSEEELRRLRIGAQT
ncbi:MAG: hypothetical protein AB1578_06070, partial [Thermodesulfobacteriota bacterium]